MGPFLPTKSNPIQSINLPIQCNPVQSGCSQVTSNPIHKYIVLNRTRKLYAANYSNADF